MPDVSIAIAARDSYSSAMKTMGQSTRAFDKDVEALQKKLDALGSRRAELEADLALAGKAARDASKQFAAMGDEVSRSAAVEKNIKYNNIKRELDAVNRASKDTVRQMETLGDSFGKAKDRGEGFGSMLKAMVIQWGGQQLGQLAQQGVGAFASSALGTAGGNMASSILSSAISAGAMGLSVGGPVGAAVGAGLGAITGAASGAIQNWASQDEAFKTYYGNQYEQTLAARAAELSTGSPLASSRETDLISFTTMFGGNRGRAKSFLRDLVTMANTTPFLYDDLTAMSKTLATYGYKSRTILPVLQTIGDTGAALGMSTSDMTMVSQALGRMKSSDKATLEYLNILNDRGVGAVGMLADAKGVSQGEMYDMISKGEIRGGEAVDIILAALEKKYAGSMEKQSQTTSGLTSTLQGWENEMANAMGNAYNEEAKKGLTADITAYNGELGKAEKAMNAVIGSGKGIAENLDRQYRREAMGAMLLGQETTVFDEETAERLKGMHETYLDLMDRYQSASESDKAGIAAQIEALKGEAETMAETAYNASGTAMSLRDAELDLITAIRENTAALGKTGWMGDYEKEQAVSKGFGSTETAKQEALELAKDVERWTGVSPEAPDDPWYIQLMQGMATGSSHAYGLDRVPYDGYRAVLHEGERVLTASQAREADRAGGGVSVTVSGNTFYVRSEADIDAIAAALAAQIQLRNQGGRL